MEYIIYKWVDEVHCVCLGVFRGCLVNGISDHPLFLDDDCDYTVVPLDP